MTKNIVGWICTDPSCNQYRKDISETKFIFKEDRIIHPVTKETELYESEIDLGDYSILEIFDACSTFGYDEATVANWIDTKSELALIAECIFELES
jgi:hypothetical protein